MFAKAYLWGKVIIYSVQDRKIKGWIGGQIDGKRRDHMLLNNASSSGNLKCQECNNYSDIKIYQKSRHTWFQKKLQVTFKVVVLGLSQANDWVKCKRKTIKTQDTCTAKIGCKLASHNGTWPNSPCLYVFMRYLHSSLPSFCTLTRLS